MVEAVEEQTAVKIRLLAMLPDGVGKIEQLFDNTIEGKQASIAEALRQLELGRLVYVGTEDDVLAMLRRLGQTERRLLDLDPTPEEVAE